MPTHRKLFFNVASNIQKLCEASIHKNITKLGVCILDFKLPNKVEISSFTASI